MVKGLDAAGSFACAISESFFRRVALFLAGEAFSRLRWLVAKWQIRQFAGFNHVREHDGEALWVFDLILHVVMALEDWKVPFGPSFHNSIAILEMVFRRPEFPVCVGLNVLRQCRKRHVYEAVGHLAPHVCQRERAACLDEVRTNGLIVAPHDMFERAAMGPIEALYGQVQQGCHKGPCSCAYLRKLAAIEKGMLNRHGVVHEKRHSQIGADGRGNEERKAVNPVLAKPFLDLAYFILSAYI